MTDTTRLPADHTADNTGDNTEAPQRPLRVVHLVFGVVFLGIAGSWALAASNTIRLDVNLAVVLPVVLILAGVTGLVAMMASAARNRRTKEPYDA